MLGGFGSIFLILFLAWLLAFVMSPVIAWLEERVDLPRPAIVVGTTSWRSSSSASSSSTPARRITQQVAELARNYPQTERDILAVLADWERGLQFGRLQIDLTDLYAGAVDRARADRPRRSSSRRRTSPA